MNETPSPAWAPGFKPVEINPPPASFVTFFPGRDATTPDFSWVDKLAAQRPITRLPAWCRVAVEASTFARRQGLIMKRVGLQRQRSAMAIVPLTAVPAGPATMTEEHPPIRRRLNKDQTEAEATMSRSPPSQAEIASSLMQAKVDVANHYHSQTTTKSAEVMKQLRTGRYYRVIPKKRRQAEDDSSDEREDVTNGNRLRTYAELTNILERAAESGTAEIDLPMASSAEASAALQQSRRDPRVHLAAQGVPDLSIIADTTEPPESPTLKLPGAKSPVKKLAGQSSPLKTPTKRIIESRVPLLPGSSPKASPSPTKSSTPSTPFKNSPRIARPTPSPAGFPKSPVPMQSPLLRPQQPDILGISSLFDSPSKDASSTNRYSNSPSVRDTPTKRPRSNAPSPTKWKGPEPGTPYQMFTPRAATPSQTDSPLGLVASLPSYFKSIPSPINPVLVESPMNIDFGPSSPSFTSGSRFQTPTNAKELHRSKSVSRALRRRSEPLARSLHKSKVRRQSMSPQKLSTTIVEAPEDNPSDSTLPLDDNDDDTVIHHDISSVTTDDDTMAEDATLPPIAGVTAAAASPIPRPTTTPIQKRNTTARHSIVEVDMRKSIDIFGTPGSSVNPAVEELARMAEDRCSGSAKVIITQENDRLTVRFKLPTKYASLFPESQGLDDLRFSSSPSMSTSPRLAFPNTKTNTKQSEELANTIDDELPDLSSSPVDGDRTLLIPDFAPSSPTRSPNSSKAIITSSAPEIATERSPVADFHMSEETDGPVSDSIVADEGIVSGLKSSTPPNETKESDISQSSSPLSELQNTPSLESSIGASATTTPAARVNDVEESSSVSVMPTTFASDIAVPQEDVQQDQSLVENKEDDNEATSEPKPTATKPDDDSPGRQYMRDFIKRSKPAKRLSTSDAGSPNAAPRLPLGVKSPNAESTQRPKRKFDIEDSESDVTKLEEPAPKKIKGMTKLVEPKTTTETRSKNMAALATATEDPVESEEEVDSDTDELSMPSETAPVARRSSRLRGKSTTSKSSIPTPIKIGRAKTTLGSMRNEQQDLSRQTIANTRRNKGKAMSPKRALERLSEEAQDESEEQQVLDLAAGKGGKSVVWKEPLAAYQEQDEQEQELETQEEKPKKGRGVPKAQAKPGPSRVARPAPKPTPVAQKQRAAAAATRLNRAGNGTPARSTRSSTRARK